MLGKLMKYDLRSGIRAFALIWIGLALLGAINGYDESFEQFLNSRQMAV